MVVATHCAVLTRDAAQVTVSDRPGGLAALCATIAGAGASVWDISHERSSVCARLSYCNLRLSGRASVFCLCACDWSYAFVRDTRPCVCVDAHEPALSCLCFCALLADTATHAPPC